MHQRQSAVAVARGAGAAFGASSQYPMQLKPMTSPDAVVPTSVAVVVVLAVWPMTSPGVVRSVAEQAQPLGAVALLPIETVTLQLPAVPLV